MPCCGVREGRKTCMKSIWPIPSAFHPGRLHISKTGRIGGGAPQFRINHIPRGVTPTWTCCEWKATSPGCNFGSLELSSGKYMKMVTLWEDEYTNLIEEEQSVETDANGKARELAESALLCY